MSVIRRVGNHFRENVYLYGFILFCFLLGIIAGSASVGALSAGQQGDLLNYFDVFLGTVGTQPVNSAALLQAVMVDRLRIILLIWFLGLTVIGVPLVMALVFARGYVLGFTVGFLISGKSVKGVILAAIALLPQNLLYIPALTVAAVAAVSFSWWLLRGRLRGSGVGLSQLFLAYCAITVAVLLMVAGACMLEAFVSPFFLQTAGKYLNL